MERGGKGGNKMVEVILRYAVAGSISRNPDPILEVDYGYYENLRVMETWMRAL